MKIDFKTLTMMALRNSPGETLDKVAEDGEVFVIERNGQPRACLVPVSFLLPDISPQKISEELEMLRAEKQDYKLTINEQKELEISVLETAAGDNVVVSIVLPHGYPKSAPRIQASNIQSNAPGRWHDGSLSIFGTMEIWDSKNHNVLHALSLAREWLKNYRKWRKTGEWPQTVKA